MAAYTSRGLRRRRARMAAGAVVMSASLLSMYAAALRAQPTYAATGKIAPRTAGCPDGSTEVADDTALQAAVASSDDSSVVCVTSDISLSTPLVLDDSSLTLVGLSDSSITLTAPVGYRILRANFDDSTTNDTLRLSYLTLTGGYTAGNGGAVYLDGYTGDGLEFQEVTLTGNSVAGSGGALAVNIQRGTGEDAPLLFYSTTWSSNYADDSGGAVFLDVDAITNGFFLSEPTLNVVFSSFTDDSTSGSGGAIYATGDDTISVTAIASTFSGEAAARGGAISAVSPSGQATVTAFGAPALPATFAYNEAGTGGAIEVHSGVGDSIAAVIGTVIFDHNHALTGDGGAILADGPISYSGLLGLPVPSPTVLSFEAFYGLTFTGQEFADNQSVGDGGAISSSGSVLTGFPTYLFGAPRGYPGATFHSNQAQNGGAISAPVLVGFDSLFDHNTALDAGGAVFLDDSATALATGLMFTDNTAGGTGGGAIAANSSTGYPQLLLSDMTASGNTTTGVGGAIAAPGNRVILANTTLDGNVADDTGGAIYAGIGEVYFTTVTNNSSGTSGGGLHILGNLTLTNSVLWNNGAVDDSDVFADPSWTVSHSSFSAADSFSTPYDDSGVLLGDPDLGPLQDNGGQPINGEPRLTRMPAWTSPIIDAGTDDTIGIVNDERGEGFPRMSGMFTDMGAIERQPPSVSSVSPTSGTVRGGTSVDIYGSGFVGAESVSFGALPAASFVIDDDTHIVAVTPPSSAGRVDVTVGSGPHESTLVSAFTFRGPTPIPTAPGAPTDVVAAAGDASATVSWKAPSTSGTTPISGYRVVGSPSGLCETTQLTCTVIGLTNDQPYTFRVEARNAAGYGTASEPSNSVTPSAAPVDKSIVIVGSRDESSQRPRILIEGATTGLAGQTVTPHLRFPGEPKYSTGVARPTVNAEGTFTWTRRTSKKTYVYFTSGAVVSNRVIIPARSQTRTTSEPPALRLPDTWGDSPSEAWPQLLASVRNYLGRLMR